MNDPDPRAYEKLVDRLLASPHYGERWGRHWLDVVRFGESEGYETNMPRPNAWPYRDYVIDAFNRDTPFPRFVLEQLAGDTLADAAGLTAAATGFLVGGTHDIVGNQTVEGMRQQRVDDLDDIITATGTAFLGLTVNCGRCHDHKFDPITQRDYYGLQAIFAGVAHGSRAIPAPDSKARRAEAARVADELAQVELRLDELEPAARPESDAAVRAMVNPRRNVERFPPVAARMARMTILATGNPAEPCVDEFEVFTAGDSPRNVALASSGGKASASSEYPGAAIHKIAHLNDGQTGNSHSWISRVSGKGTLTIEWPRAETVDRIVWSRDRQGQYKDRLATEYYLEVALKPGEWHVVASSLDRLPFRADGGGGPAEPAGLTSELASRRAELMSRQAGLRARLDQLGDHDLGLRRDLQPARGDPRPPPGRPDAAAGRGLPVGNRRGAAPPGAAARRLRARPANRPGAMDRRPRESAARAGDGQPGLALPLRPGHRRHPQRLRLQRQSRRRTPSCSTGWPARTSPGDGGSSRSTG